MVPARRAGGGGHMTEGPGGGQDSRPGQIRPASPPSAGPRPAPAGDASRMTHGPVPADDYAPFGLGLALARSGSPGAAAEYLALAAAMRPDLPHYTGALRGVRATLRARDQAQTDAGTGTGDT